MRKLINLFIALLLTFSLANPSLAYGWTLPEGHDNPPGVTFEPNGNELLITGLSDLSHTVINWLRFCIGEGYTVKFAGWIPGSNILNRVAAGGDPSYIMGNLSASNLNIFIVNPNGIVFGANSRVDVGGLVASTLNISNEDFFKGCSTGNFAFYGNGTPALIKNLGTIQVGDFAAFLAGAIDNEGYVLASFGKVALAAGEQIVLNLDADGQISIAMNEEVMSMVYDLEGNPVDAAIVNEGVIEANAVLINAQVLPSLFEHAVNLEGVIRANAVVNNGGVIEIICNDRARFGENSVTEASDKIDVASQGLDTTGIFRAPEINFNAQDGDINIQGDYWGDTLFSDNRNIRVVGALTIHDGALTLHADANGDADGYLRINPNKTVTTFGYLIDLIAADFIINGDVISNGGNIRLANSYDGASFGLGSSTWGSIKLDNSEISRLQTGGGEIIVGSDTAGNIWLDDANFGSKDASLISGRNIMQPLWSANVAIYAGKLTMVAQSIGRSILGVLFNLGSMETEVDSLDATAINLGTSNGGTANGGLWINNAKGLSMLDALANTDINISADGDMTVGSVASDVSVSLTSDIGSILDDGNKSTAVAAPIIDLYAFNNIGSIAPYDFTGCIDVILGSGNISLTTVDGDACINEIGGDLNISQISLLNIGGIDNMIALISSGGNLIVDTSLLTGLMHQLTLATYGDLEIYDDIDTSSFLIGLFGDNIYQYSGTVSIPDGALEVEADLDGDGFGVFEQTQGAVIDAGAGELNVTTPEAALIADLRAAEISFAGGGDIIDNDDPLSDDVDITADILRIANARDVGVSGAIDTEIDNLIVDYARNVGWVDMATGIIESGIINEEDLYIEHIVVDNDFCVEANSDLKIGTITGQDVALFANSGDIKGDGIHNPNITAVDLYLEAAGNIGTELLPILTIVENLWAYALGSIGSLANGPGIENYGDLYIQEAMADNLLWITTHSDIIVGFISAPIINLIALTGSILGDGIHAINIVADYLYMRAQGGIGYKNGHHTVHTNVNTMDIEAGEHIVMVDHGAGTNGYLTIDHLKSDNRVILLTVNSDTNINDMYANENITVNNNGGQTRINKMEALLHDINILSKGSILMYGATQLIKAPWLRTCKSLFGNININAQADNLTAQAINGSVTINDNGLGSNGLGGGALTIYDILAKNDISITTNSETNIIDTPTGLPYVPPVSGHGIYSSNGNIKVDVNSGDLLVGEDVTADNGDVILIAKDSILNNGGADSLISGRNISLVAEDGDMGSFDSDERLRTSASESFTANAFNGSMFIDDLSAGVNPLICEFLGAAHRIDLVVLNRGAFIKEADLNQTGGAVSITSLGDLLVGLINAEDGFVGLGSNGYILDGAPFGADSFIRAFSLSLSGNLGIASSGNSIHTQISELNLHSNGDVGEFNGGFATSKAGITNIGDLFIQSAASGSGSLYIKNFGNITLGDGGNIYAPTFALNAVGGSINGNGGGPANIYAYDLYLNADQNIGNINPLVINADDLWAYANNGDIYIRDLDGLNIRDVQALGSTVSVLTAGLTNIWNVLALGFGAADLAYINLVNSAGTTNIYGTVYAHGTGGASAEINVEAQRDLFIDNSTVYAHSTNNTATLNINAGNNVTMNNSKASAVSDNSGANVNVAAGNNIQLNSSELLSSGDMMLDATLGSILGTGNVTHLTSGGNTAIHAGYIAGDSVNPIMVDIGGILSFDIDGKAGSATGSIGNYGVSGYFGGSAGGFDFIPGIRNFDPLNIDPAGYIFFDFSTIKGQNRAEIWPTKPTPAPTSPLAGLANIFANNNWLRMFFLPTDRDAYNFRYTAFDASSAYSPVFEYHPLIAADVTNELDLYLTPEAYAFVENTIQVSASAGLRGYLDLPTRDEQGKEKKELESQGPKEL